MRVNKNPVALSEVNTGLDGVSSKTLYKALIEGIWIKDSLFSRKIEFVRYPVIFTDNYYDCNYETGVNLTLMEENVPCIAEINFGLGIMHRARIKDYGITWALTAEELEEKSIEEGEAYASFSDPVEVTSISVEVDFGTKEMHIDFPQPLTITRDEIKALTALSSSKEFQTHAKSLFEKFGAKISIFNIIKRGGQHHGHHA